MIIYETKDAIGLIPYGLMIISAYSVIILLLEDKLRKGKAENIHKKPLKRGK